MRILDLRLGGPAPDYDFSIDQNNQETHMLVQQPALHENEIFYINSAEEKIQLSDGSGNLKRIRVCGEKVIQFHSITRGKKELKFKIFAGNWAEIWLAEFALYPDEFKQTDLLQQKIRFILGEPEKDHVLIEDNDPHTFKLAAITAGGRRSAVFFKGGEEVKMIKSLYRKVRLNARKNTFKEFQNHNTDRLYKNFLSLMAF